MDFFITFYQDYWYIIWYLAVSNVATFIFYGLDKYYAQKNAWRIRERTLLFFALLGGSLGALAGMHFFRHKTKKDSFIIWLVLIILLQIIALFYLIPLAVDYFSNLS
jgi:uncharacterized membrane protein YsdA (DUF1294 family)